MNPQECVWETRYRTITKIILQEKGWEFITALQFGSQIYSYASSLKHSSSRSSGGQGMGKIGEKIQRGIWRKVRSKKEVIDEARMSGATVHFVPLMDIYHLKNAELEVKHQKYKGRVVFWGDVVKDNLGSYAIFIQQGSPASQMTAAKVMDIISRLLGCDGQAVDAASAYTQVENSHGLFNILTNCSKSECPDIWIRLPRHKWPKSWSSMEYPVVPSWAESVWSSSGRTIVGETIWEDLIEVWLGENSKLGISLRTSWKRIILISICGCYKIGCQEIKSWSDVEITQQRSLLRENQLLSWKFRISSWFYDMDDDAKKCVKRYCESANKTTQQLYTASISCAHDRSGQPDKRNDSVHHEIKIPNIDNETIRERIEEDMDFKIPGLWSKRTVPTFENWFRKSRTTQIDMLFDETYDRINHSILSVQNSKQMIHDVGNIEMCELLDTEPKTKCKVFLSYWDIDIFYCTCGHLFRKGTEE